MASLESFYGVNALTCVKEIFEDCRDLVQSAVDGHNAVTTDTPLSAADGRKHGFCSGDRHDLRSDWGRQDLHLVPLSAASHRQCYVHVRPTAGLGTRTSRGWCSI